MTNVPEVTVIDCVFDSPHDEHVRLALQLRPGLDPDLTLDRMKTANATGYLWSVARDGEALVGLSGYRRIDTISSGATLYIHDFVVEERRRGKGIGSALLRHVVSRARALDCRSVQLDTGFSRSHAHRFYESRGFERSGYSFKLDPTDFPPGGTHD